MVPCLVTLTSAIAESLVFYCRRNQSRRSTAWPSLRGWAKCSPSKGWGGNRRTGVKLAKRYRHSGMSSCGLDVLYGLWHGENHPAYATWKDMAHFTFVLVSASL